MPLPEETTKARSGRRIVFFLLAIALAFGAGFTFGKPSQHEASAAGKSLGKTATSLIVTDGTDPAAPSDIKPGADFQEFWDLWRLLKERYYKQPVDEQKMFYGAMAGMTAALEDPYTTFFEPKTATEFSQELQGKFEGIGAEIGIKDDQLQIISPLEGLPAEKAGLRPGDWILSIDKQDTTNMSVEKAVSLIRGTKGTSVTLTIGRKTTVKDKLGHAKPQLDTKDYTVVRDTIVVASVHTKYLANGIALIEITHFNEDTDTLFAKAVEDVSAKNPKGIILDLRNDPGGFLDRATAVAGAWVGKDVVVVERQQGKMTDQIRGTTEPRFGTIPTVVLVNQGSASAAEIVAGALQDYGKAKLVGMKTYGKGSVQDYIDLGDGSAVKITIAEWMTPNGRLIDKLGIDPDVTVDRTIDDINAQRDPQLDKALEILTGKPSTSKTPKKTGK